MKIFIVEKDKQFRELIGRYILENTNHKVNSFDNPELMLSDLRKNPEILIINIYNTVNSDEILSQIQKYKPSIHLLLICQPENISTCIKLFGYGIYDILNTGKGFAERLLNSIRQIKQLESLKKEVSKLKFQINEKYDISRSIIGESKAMKHVQSLVQKAISVQNIIVSIHGESGTGKELIARTIHFNSLRKNSPFITVNMGALPIEMVESELFGHEKGSNPGAYSRFIGKLEQANYGTLFINEITELNLNLQYKLFRVIQEKAIRRTGSNTLIPIETRIIIATSKELREEVENGRFREDLYYAILGLPILIPPLSDRESDIIILAEYFLKTFCEKNNIKEKTFSPEARNKLLTHNYPGNVRELYAIVELGAVLSNNQVIGKDQILFSPTKSGLDVFNMDISLREFEIKIIKHFLEKYNNNVVLVAKKLKIGKSKIYNMIKNGEL